LVNIKTPNKFLVQSYDMTWIRRL